MSTWALPDNPAPAHGPTAVRAGREASPALPRSLLVLGVLICVLAAASLGDADSFVHADPQLAVLLRGMGLIKGAMALASVAVVWWRFGHPVSRPTAAAYIAGTAVLAGASTLIWELSFIPAAALGFHAAALVLGVAAWRDDGAEFQLLPARADTAPSARTRSRQRPEMIT